MHSHTRMRFVTVRQDSSFKKQHQHHHPQIASKLSAVGIQANNR